MILVFNIEVWQIWDAIYVLYKYIKRLLPSSQSIMTLQLIIILPHRYSRSCISLKTSIPRLGKLCISDILRHYPSIFPSITVIYSMDIIGLLPIYHYRSNQLLLLDLSPFLHFGHFREIWIRNTPGLISVRNRTFILFW